MAADAGTYVCAVTNSFGVATTTATLTVAAAPDPGYLVNLSGRGAVGSDAASALFGGFVVGGAGSKQLFVRGIGPGLATHFNLAGALPDPLLTVFNSLPAPIAQNDNWSGATALAEAEAALGAFTVPASSLDAMLLAAFPAGGYSCQVTANGGATGIALVELYDADPAPPTARLVNLSARSAVGTGGAILIGGFVIGGATSETVLIRGVGPGLASTFKLAGTLAQPVLNLFNSSQKLIDANTGWAGDPGLAGIFRTVGAFPFDPSSRDSALLVTLPPAATPSSSAASTAAPASGQIEIYEVP